MIKIAALYLIAFPAGAAVMAQIPIPDDAWRMVIQSGFNALLVILLLWIGRGDLKAQSNESREAARRTQEAIDRNTLGLTQVILAMAFLPKQFHENTKALSQYVHDAQEARKQE